MVSMVWYGKYGKQKGQKLEFKDLDARVPCPFKNSQTIERMRDERIERIERMRDERFEGIEGMR